MKAKRALVIVGAGISVPPPTGAPDFAQLRNRFLNLAAVDLDVDAFALDELSPEQVFDAIDDGNEELRQAVRRELWWLCEPREPNPNHYAVAALVGAGVTVWTPNYDTMIERAAARLGLDIRVVAAPAPPDGQTEPCLFKPHGSFPYTGDPPHEPSTHDYRLLFQASDVWLMDESWAEQLLADASGSEVWIFGYRGADPDLTPVMLRAFEEAATVLWWEFPHVRNFERLRTMLANALQVEVKPGDPSAALQEFAQKLTPHFALRPRGVSLTPPPTSLKLSYLSQASIVGSVAQSKVARKLLWRALRYDDRNKSLAAFRLIRSLGYDINALRAPLLLAAGVALHIPRVRNAPRLSEFYATMIDARTVRAGDRRRLQRLLATSDTERAEILVRAASTEKLLGDLETAARHGEHAREDALRRRQPALEAMAAYNLAWIYRQQGAFDLRRTFVSDYRDRLPHIGFNWAAWLSLDEVLVALHFGDVAAARETMDSPFVEYARLLVQHPRFRLDDALTEVVLRWHEGGPGGMEHGLTSILAEYPVRPFGHPSFTALETMILLADHARASGDRPTMNQHLRRAARRTESKLQLAEIELVRLVAANDHTRLSRFAIEAATRGFGLVAQTAEAVLAFERGGPSILTYQPHLPLAGIY